MWPVESIPDSDNLYMRIHHNQIRDDAPIPGAFKDHEGGMSTDWNKYSTPFETRRRGRKPEQEYGVVSLPVGGVRSIPNLTVVHEPLPVNRAHSEVFGEKDTEARLKLCRLYQWQVR